jgi:hypothetical protein
VPGGGGGGGTEGEAEDGEVDLLRRVGVGGADPGGEAAAVERGSGRGLREEEGARRGGGRMEGEQRRFSGEESHGGLVVSVRAVLQAAAAVTSLFRCLLRPKCLWQTVAQWVTSGRKP